MCFAGFQLLAGCTSLSKSQLTEINQFGRLTRDFSAGPAKVTATLSAIQGQNQLFQSAIIQDPEKHLASVTAIYRFTQESAKRDARIALLLQIVGDYGQKLVRLTADLQSLQLDTAAQSLGTNLDNLLDKYNAAEPSHTVPTGIGALFGHLISFGGGLYIHDRQAKGAKEFVSRGDTIIGTMALRLLHLLEDKEGDNLTDRLAHEREVVDRNYKAYLAVDNEPIRLYVKTDTLYRKNRFRRNDLMAKKDTVITGALKAWRSNAMDADSLYLKLLGNLDAAEILRRQCITAVAGMRTAHHKLLEDLQQKKDLKELYTELRDYGNSVSKMYSTFKKIK